MKTQRLSPFQQTNDALVSWTTLPTGYLRKKNFPISSENEKKALEALNYVGLMPISAFENIYGISKKQVKYMCFNNKLVEHTIASSTNSFKVPFYSLGENAALELGTHDNYRLNYWREYKIKDILKCLLFFRFYERLLANGHNITVFPTSKPYIAGIQYPNEDKIYVYVAKGDTHDLTSFYKWAKGKELNRRLYIVLERFEQLDMFERTFSKVPCRIVLERDLFVGDTSIPIPQYFINKETMEFTEDENAKV